jgi:hypothetical protein
VEKCFQSHRGAPCGWNHVGARRASKFLVDFSVIDEDEREIFLPLISLGPMLDERRAENSISGPSRDLWRNFPHKKNRVDGDRREERSSEESGKKKLEILLVLIIGLCLASMQKPFMLKNAF